MTDSTPSLEHLARDVLTASQELVHAEIRVVKARGVQALLELRHGIFLALIALVLTALAVVVLVGLLATVLGSLLHMMWLGWCIMFVILLAAAALTGYRGYRTFRATATSASDTMTSVKEEIEWLKKFAKQSVKGTNNGTDSQNQ